MTPTGLPPAARVAVLDWYDANGRSLAFRSTRDPWAVLVSEVMAQQTQVSRVVEAWAAFLLRFPTPTALAASSPADVLRAWQGMGYDRRALNLRRAAIAIRDEHGGRVPDDLVALDRLPGVGPYTARAVAAIAFGRPVGAVDTNVRRVLGRAVAGPDGPSRPAPWIQDLADASVDRGRPGDWTHALMDVGATICRPRNPRCAECPIRPWCVATDAIAIATPTRERARGDQPPPPFASTTRWLRGRIVDRLRAARDGTWTAVEAPIGSHAEPAVAAALAALARDGVIERDPVDPGRARLATH